MSTEKRINPKACKFCKHYIQHYAKLGYTRQEFIPINDGHCVAGVPVKKGGKKNPVPDDTCAYFELGNH